MSNYMHKMVKKLNSTINLTQIFNTFNHIKRKKIKFSLQPKFLKEKYLQTNLLNFVILINKYNIQIRTNNTTIIFLKQINKTLNLSKEVSL
jgi:hypothetical protein